MKLYDTGVYLLNGQKIVPENQADVPVSKEEAAKNTILFNSGSAQYFWKYGEASDQIR